MIYRFSIFTYDLDQQVLSHDDVPIEITKKNHELLQYFLQQPKRLISRDELIDHVWHGRVVTNNTIDQCILKLRKALNQVDEGEYIESVYGQGVRFLPVIDLQKSTSTTASNATSKHSNKGLWMGFAVFALVIIIGYWQLSKKDYGAIEALDQAIIAQQNAQPVLTAKLAKDDWLLYGGSSYLGYILHLYPNISLQKTQRNNASGAQKANIILDLIRADQSKQVIQIDLYQQLSPGNEINSYHADLSLISESENLAHTQITTNQLTVLFPQIATWIAQLDASETPQQVIDQNIFTQNEQALLNYFRGLVEQITGNSELALKYFNKAIDLDPDFKVAWYEMAIATAKQGDRQKGISVLNAIDSNDQWMTYRAAIAKAIMYGELNDSEAAIKAYAVALKIAEDSNDAFKLAIIYTNKAILYSDMKLYEEAEQQLILAIEHTDVASHPNLYGSIMHTYTNIAKQMNNLPLAIELSQSAIEAYQTTGDVRYEMQSKTRLAGLLLDSNEFNQAELLVKESLSYAKQLKNSNAVSSNRNKLAFIYQNTGRFALAIEQWQAVIALNTENNTSDYNAEVYYWLMRLNLASNKPDQANIILDMMQQWVDEAPSSDRQVQFTEVSLLLALYHQDIQKAQQLIAQMTSISSEKLLVYQGDLAKLMGDELLAETHYLDAAEILTQQGIPHQLTEVLNRLSDLYLNYETHKLTANLQRTKHLKPFIYPLQKYQAIAASKQDNGIKALSLLAEVKLKSGGYWQPVDQELLDQMQTASTLPAD